MFGNRHQFDVRIPHFFDVRDQLFGKFPVRQPAVAFLHFALPRTEMDFVNADRLFVPFGLSALFEPRSIVPLITAEVANHRRRARAHFGGERVRVGFLRPETVRSLDLKFILIALFDTGNEQLPATSPAPDSIPYSFITAERREPHN